MTTSSRGRRILDKYKREKVNSISEEEPKSTVDVSHIDEFEVKMIMEGYLQGTSVLSIAAAMGESEEVIQTILKLQVKQTDINIKVSSEQTEQFNIGDEVEIKDNHRYLAGRKGWISHFLENGEVFITLENETVKKIDRSYLKNKELKEKEKKKKKKKKQVKQKKDNTTISTSPKKKRQKLSSFKVGDQVIMSGLKLTSPRYGLIAKIEACTGKKYDLRFDDGKLRKNISCKRLQKAQVSPQNLEIGKRLQKAKMSPQNLEIGKRLQKAKASLQNLEIGQVRVGRISKIIPHLEIWVNIQDVPVRSISSGTVHITDVSDTWPTYPFSEYTIGQTVQLSVLDIGETKAIFSLRKSRLQKKRIKRVNDKNKHPLSKTIVELTEVSQLRKGQIVKGYVRKSNESGCVVSLNHAITGIVKPHDLRDSLVLPRAVAELFPIGKLVTAKVMSIFYEQRTINLTLAKSQLSVKTPMELKKDMVVKAMVTKVGGMGVYLRIVGEITWGICPWELICEKETTENEIKKYYSVGDIVRAVFLKHGNPANVFGLKPSLFPKGKLHDKDNNADADSEDDPDEDYEDDIDDIDYNVFDHKIKNKWDIAWENAPSLKVDLASFDHTQNFMLIDDKTENEDNDNESDEESDSGYDDFKGKKRLTMGQRRTRRLKKERDLLQREEELAQLNRAPEKAMDFQRLLISSPNSSFVWIKYMDFHVTMTEFKKARSVAERAIKKISFTEEREKMNVWVAYLNLENMYGDEELLEKVFKRACQYCDKLEITLAMGQIFASSGKIKAAKDTFEKGLKKFGQTIKFWKQYGMFFYHQKLFDEGRELMQRSINRLDKRLHIEMICKFAQMEFRMGSIDRGRTLLEGIIANYPKRLDIFSQYIDIEIGLDSKPRVDPDPSLKEDNKAAVRRLFERVVHQRLSTKKMKFFLKRYLDYETKYGDETTREHVKEIATDFVQRKET